MKVVFKPSTWKCSLLIGSVVTWALGLIILGLSLSTIRKPIFIPSLGSVVSSIYNSLVVALAGGIFICVVALLGCCGAACKKPCLLFVYASGLVILFVYQVVSGISLLYEKSEAFPNLQFLSVDLCQYRKQSRGRQGRQLSEEDLVESITRAEANARLFNRNVALLLEQQKAKGQAAECQPIRDLLSPIAFLMFIAAALYVYLAFCTLKLTQHIWTRRQEDNSTVKIKYKSERQCSGITLSNNDEFLQSLLENHTPIHDSVFDNSSEKSNSSPTSAIFVVHRPPTQTLPSESTRAESKCKSITSPLPLPSRSSRLSASPSVFLTPQQPSDSPSSGSMYVTPPAHLVPAITIKPATT